MLENATIARPYATAVFELAQETGRVQDWSDILGLLSRVVSDNGLRGLITNPRVSRQQLQELVFDVCGAGLTVLGRNFVKTLVQAERLQYAPYVKDLYERMRATAEGKVEVAVITAYPLDEPQRAGIAATMAARLGKRVTVSTSVDEALIGGAVIRAGDSIIDASLRGHLNKLRNELVR